MPRKQRAALGRRRGASSTGTSINQPLYTAIKIMACIAVLLSISIVGLFAVMGPDRARTEIRTNKQRIAGLPHMFRGNIPQVNVPPVSNAAEHVTQLQKKRRVKKDGTGKSDSQLPDDDEPHDRKKWELNARNKLGNSAQAPPAGGGNGGVQLDLNRYDGPPVKEYPYPLEKVDPDYDVHTKWTPLGGMRFSEYTTGGTPYKITPELRAKSDDVARSRRHHIKKTMQHAWGGYVRYAFGKDEILPQSGRGNNNWGGQGITLVDSLDTLWLMGMKDKFYQARDWVRDHLQHDQVSSISVFETTIRDLGGLLSAYDWSHDKVFLDKALDLGERLIRSFNNRPSGIPWGQVDLSTGRGSNVGWSGGNVILAESGTLQIENRYLTKATGRPEFAQKTEHVFDVLQQISPPNGLFPYFLRVSNNAGTPPTFANDKLTFGAMGDSLYEYMLKIWIQGGQRETRYREMYDLAMDSMHKELLQTSTPSGLTYVADKTTRDGRIDHKMDHLACFLGGLLALGAYTDPLGMDSERAQRDLRTGKALTYTCYQMYARMNTGISPEFVQFYPGKDLQIGRGAPHYLLRPEAFESFYILNVITGDPAYREWGWEAYQSIEKYCKTDIAYGALSNVQDTSGKPRDSMESFFLAETLKYLYLLQDPDSEVDILHKHVFNTEAHPMRIFPVIDQEGFSKIQ